MYALPGARRVLSSVFLVKENLLRYNSHNDININNIIVFNKRKKNLKTSVIQVILNS